jgi:anoctamin-10
MKWGTRGCESASVGKLRPEYVANNNLNQRSQGDVVGAVNAWDHVQRDAKVLLSVPVIAICGVLLGTVLMGIFLLEAFVAQAYEGIGHQVLVSLMSCHQGGQLIGNSRLSRPHCLYW